MRHDDNIPNLYTDAEAAKLMRVKRITVGRLRRSGKMGYTRVGRKVFVTAEHIREYLQRQEVPRK